MHKEEVTKANFIKKLHVGIITQIQKQTQKYIRHKNKGKREIVFNEGDSVWIHLRKDRFLIRGSLNLVPEEIVMEHAFIQFAISLGEWRKHQ